MSSPPTGLSPGGAWNFRRSCPGAGEVEHAGLEGRRVDELQRHRVAGLGEQPLAVAEHDREDEQVQFVQ